jgi:LysR family transcriptional regulator (chromosome initiation inhibitor)
MMITIFQMKISNPNKLDYNSLLALKTAYESGNFSKGAKAMRVTKSAMFQRIKALETLVGGPVLKRGTKLELTRIGKFLVSHIDRVTDLEQDLKERLPQLGIKQRNINIAVNADSLSTWWFNTVSKVALNLGIYFNIVVADQDVAIKKMTEGDVIACLCSTKKSLAGARAIKIRTMNYRMYANKAFHKRYFADNSIEDAIISTPAIIYGKDDDLHNAFLRKIKSETNYPYHTVPDAGGLVQSIFAGIGYGLLADEQVATLADSSCLEDIAPGEFLAVDLYWHYWRNSSDTLIKFSHSLKNTVSKIQN